MKYIDADLLRKEIERFISTEYNGNTFGDDVANGALDYVLDIITSLQQEQQERDLEKEYKEFVEDDPVYNKLVNGIVGKQIARHFYELGKNNK